MYTGQVDVNGKKIRVGDRVLKWWGCINTGIVAEDGTPVWYDEYQIHEVVLSGNSFRLGRYYNKWEGSEVEKLPKNRFVNIPNDHTMYRVNDKLVEFKDVPKSEAFLAKEKAMAEYFYKNLLNISPLI